MKKLIKAAKDLKISQVAVAGGVSANSALRQAIQDAGVKYKWDVFIPPLGYTTDNAAMVGITGYFKYQDKEFCPVNAVPFARVEI